MTQTFWSAMLLNSEDVYMSIRPPCIGEDELVKVTLTHTPTGEWVQGHCVSESTLSLTEKLWRKLSVTLSTS